MITIVHATVIKDFTLQLLRQMTYLYFHFDSCILLLMSSQKMHS